MTQNQAFEKYLRSRQKAVDRDNTVVERQLAEMYRQAYDYAADELAKLYARLGDKMSLPEAQKYKRLELLMAELKKEYTKVSGKALATAIDTSAQNYTEAFYGYEWAMNQALQTQLTWGVVPVDAIRASVMSENSGLNIVKTFKKNAQQELSAIQSAITRGIATGTGYAKTAAGMKDAYNRGLSDSLRVVRTEAGRNYTEGQLLAHDRAVDMGIKVVKVWSAAKDWRTRDAHGALDGTAADKNGLFHDINGASGTGPGLMSLAESVINCRCRLVDRIEGFTQEYMRVHGEDEPVPYQTFAQWAGNKGWTQDKGWPKVRGL